MRYYRFEVDRKGVYEQVDIDCPRDTACRANKPDGSWLARVGTQYPGATSYFTEEGLRKYVESGLAEWHASVVNGDVQKIVAQNPRNILYEDEDQIILMKGDIDLG